jgi:hypothetical protein
LNEFTLVLSEELSGRGIVVDEEVSTQGDNYRQQTFLQVDISVPRRLRVIEKREAYQNEDPTPAVVSANSTHMRDTLPER